MMMMATQLMVPLQEQPSIDTILAKITQKSCSNLEVPFCLSLVFKVTDGTSDKKTNTGHIFLFPAVFRHQTEETQRKQNMHCPLLAA